MDKRYYIAYGSNLNVYQMRYRCPNARIIGTAIMLNYELLFKGIKTGKVRNRKVYVYIMNEERPIGIPTKSYVRTCIEGYHNFGFDIDVLKEAYERSRKECLK